METLLIRVFELAALSAALYLLGFCYRRASRAKTVLKTISVAALAIAALLGNAPIWLPLALAACAFGDYYLSREGNIAFLKGMGAFAVGHLLYMILFLTDPLSDSSLIFTNSRVAILSVLVVFATVMLVLLWFYAGNLRRAVAVYIMIIMALGFAATTLPWLPYYDTVLLGVMFFILSDLVLSMEMFLMSDEGWARNAAPFIVWAFYWMAQLLITAGFVLRGLQS